MANPLDPMTADKTLAIDGSESDCQTSIAIQLQTLAIDGSESDCQTSIAIQLQVSSNDNQLDPTFNSLLIPGYLLVKNCDDSSTYHLQQTVMQIEVQSDPHDIHVLPISVANSSHNHMTVTTDDNTNQSVKPIKSTLKKDKKTRNNCLPSDDNSTANQTNDKLLPKKSGIDKNGRKIPPSRLLQTNCPVCDKQFKKTYLANPLDPMTADKTLAIDGSESDCQTSIAIQLQVSSNDNQLDPTFNSLLIPGYLLVKNCDDSSTYHLQQTVMQIEVQSDPHDIHVLPISVANSSHNQMTVTTDDNTNQSVKPIKSTLKKDKKTRNNCLPSDDNSTANQTNDKLLPKKSGIDKNGRKIPPSRLLQTNCPVCDKQFKKTYLKEHMKVHDNHRPYKCLICGKTYRWRTLLRNHKKTHLSDNPFTCPVCGLRMSSKFSVQQHVLKSHDNSNKSYECNECDKKYVTIHQLRAHQKYHKTDRTRHRRIHKGEENSIDVRLKCSACGLICHSKTHYTAHQRIHTGEKPFVCETCGKTFRQIAQLNQHRIVHTELRPFSCNLCDRTFRCRSNLRLHLDHHNGQRRHQCTHCDQKFFSYPNMLKHIRRKHLGLLPFKCLLCENKSFCEKQELESHMRMHSGEKRPKPKRKRLPLPVPQTNANTEL
ncbi:unnamed protein product [Medioppia subpectinata]|uniref:C2H2-type domain-containing protein n=1 Tax=Medioppia subpectinata TaxID=1979941 RepID=A0A7R9KKN3_9ACAR|nr:unnamed protein product [Medioppia subpectinata]CAG2104990.1 unnamed protein product [Medioppia subpectinata]